MKDLILITAYCPDNNKLEKLRILVNQLYNFKDEYDVMLVSHTSIPIDIQNKVNVYLFDDKNKILTDHDLLNKPWFDPDGGGTILFGSTQSFNIDKLPISLLKYDEKEIKNLIRNANSKSPEILMQETIHNNGSYFSKSSSVLFKKGNKFATSNNDDGFNPWGVPYIDLNDGEYKFIVWNTKKDLVTYKIIVNDNHLININNISKGTWKIKTLGLEKNVFKIIVIEDDKVRNVFDLDSPKDKKLFGKMSWRNKNKE